jgi:uncharacterized protein (TIGR03435 family)
MRRAVFVLVLSIAAAAQTAAAPASFEVASIRVNKDSADGHHHIYNDPAESRFRTANLPLRALVQYAYDLPESQILGGPPWLDSVMFDIEARSDSSVDAQFHALPAEQARFQKRLMVQTLLSDRFHFKAHQEARQLPVYALVLAKGGPTFKPSGVSGTTVDTGRTYLHVSGSDNTLQLLARVLAQQLGRVVLNKTGISGRFDLSLKWTPDDASIASAAAPDAPPGVFTAIQEQLGLRLESTKAAVPVLVIDQVDMPTAN